MTQIISNDLKIIVIGNSGTGKTSFVKRWLGEEYKENYKPTIISEFSHKIYNYKETNYRVQLWDIGGQDKSPAVTKIFSKDSHGCLVLNDATDPDSLEETLIWKNVVEEESVFIDGGKIPFFLVQNKIDLISEEEKQKIESDSKNFCEENEFVHYFLTSAKENININESMNYLLDHVINRLLSFVNQGNKEAIDDNNERKSVRLTSGEQAFGAGAEDIKKSCCNN